MFICQPTFRVLLHGCTLYTVSGIGSQLLLGAFHVQMGDSQLLGSMQTLLYPWSILGGLLYHQFCRIGQWLPNPVLPPQGCWWTCSLGYHLMVVLSKLCHYQGWQQTLSYLHWLILWLPCWLWVWWQQLYESVGWRCCSTLTAGRCKYPLLISTVWVLLSAAVIRVRCDVLQSGRTWVVNLG